MRYFIDCEFDGHGGPLLSLAMVAEGGPSLYVTIDEVAFDPWVRENVFIDMNDYSLVDLVALDIPEREAGSWIRRFLAADQHPIIIADSPVDIGHFCCAISTAEHGGWASCDYPLMTFEVHNVDCYPTTLEGAVQHNAWWDAMALREKLAS